MPNPDAAGRDPDGMGDAAGHQRFDTRWRSPPPDSGREELVTAALSSGDLDKAVLALDRLKRQEGIARRSATSPAMIKMAQLDLDGARTVLSDMAKASRTRSDKINLAKVLIVQDKPKDAEQLRRVLEHDPGERRRAERPGADRAGDGRVQRAVRCWRPARRGAANAG